MRCKCEVAVHDILPVARAMIAKTLIDVYGFSQTQTAKKMGLSQPALSQYKQKIRGKGSGSLKPDSQFEDICNDISKRIANGSLKPDQLQNEMCRLCSLVDH